MAKKTDGRKNNSRPTKYSQKVLELTDKYIEDAQKDLTKLPKIESLAIVLKVERKTLYNWANNKKGKEFKQRLEQINALQLERLIDVGIFQKCNPAIVKMMLINNHHMKSDNIDNNLVGKLESKFNDKQIEKIAKRINRRCGNNGDTSITE